MDRIELLPLDGIPLVEAGDALAALIVAATSSAGLALADGDIVVVAQKIVSKAEGRLARLDQVTPTARAIELAKAAEKDPRLVELILSESSDVLRHRPGLIIVRHRLGMVLANAGIDASNIAADGGNELVLLLPLDPDASAARLRDEFGARTGAKVGVVISDSVGRAWRVGIVGIAIGVAGLPAVVDERGTPDLFDRPLLVTQTGLADEVASAASLLQGQAAQGRPVVLVRGLASGAPEGRAGDLIRPLEHDMFR